MADTVGSVTCAYLRAFQSSAVPAGELGVVVSGALPFQPPEGEGAWVSNFSSLKSASESRDKAYLCACDRAPLGVSEAAEE